MRRTMSEMRQARAPGHAGGHKGRLIAVAAILLGSAAASGVVPRLHRERALDETQAAMAAPRLVRVAQVTVGQTRREVTVPGTCQPFQVTALYAKSTGFVRRNLVDVGDPVKAGQLLAEIDAPE